MSPQTRLALLLAAIALAPVACKRKMDDVIPNSTPSATAAASVAAATASAKASAADDTAEPLAPLSSAKIVAPTPAAAPKSDAAAPKGTAAAAPVPQECGAAVLMKKLGKVNEAETLRIKCVEKGGKDPFAK